MTCPCKDCAERKVGCHAECQPYKTYSEWRAVFREKRHEERSITYALLEGFRRTKQNKNPKKLR